MPTDVAILIAELKRLDAAATPGPWRYNAIFGLQPVSPSNAANDGESTAALRNALPRLIRLLEAGERVADTSDRAIYECDCSGKLQTPRHVCDYHEDLAAWHEAGKDGER